MKSVATAFITTPAAVQAYAASKGQQSHTGAIYVKCPELGFDTEPLYCRYGLSIPYYEVQKDEKVLIEPTFGNDERWFYTGIVDSAGTIPTESYVLGDTLKTQLDTLKSELDAHVATFNAHVHVLTIAAAPGTGGTGTAAPPAAGQSNVSGFTTAILSQVIKGK